MMRLTLALAALAALASSQAARAGPLSLRSFFDGPLTAVGTVENLRDGTRRDFTIAMQGSWSGPKGTLVEDVAYADGERDRKVWSFEDAGGGHYVGRRPDVTADADVVEDDGGVRMTYKAATKVPAGLTLNLSFADRLTRIAPDKVAVRSDVSYLFVPAATLTLTITKAPVAPGKASRPKPARQAP